MNSVTYADSAGRPRDAVVRSLSEQSLQLARARFARRMTPILLHRLGIPPHAARLPLWLTDRNCATNEEAVQAWIEAQLGDPELAPACSACVSNALVARLTRILVDLELDALDAL